MEERDKLIEAARMIYDNCVKHAVGKHCIFADDGMCKGTENCSIGNEIKLPYDWRIPKPCRWTQADANMAKALVSVGFTFVQHVKNYNGVFAMDGIGLECRIPVGLFSSVKSDEIVQLQDIIAEYEKCNGGK